MNYPIPIILSLVTLTVSAQNPPSSVLSQFPYIPDAGEEAPAYLDVNDALKKLPPLPDFKILDRLPNEFLLNDKGRELWRRSQEANSYLMAGEPEKAVAIFQEAIQAWPEEMGIRVALADSLFAMGALRESEAQYRMVLEKIPLHFQCLNNLAWLYATAKDPAVRDIETAYALAVQAKVVQPRSHHLWSTLSQIYFEQGKYADAENAINNALLIAQQSQINLEVVIAYLIQRDRCAIARQATSLLE